MSGTHRVSSLIAFFFSLCVTFTTAYAVDLDPATHQAIPGDFNGDGRIDALLQPLSDSVGGALLLQDGTGNLSVVAQGWDPGYLGLDWSAGKSAITPADLNGDGLADVVIQPRQAGNSAAVLVTDPTVQLLQVAQVIPANYLGLDWSTAGHVLVAGDFDGDRQNELLLQAVNPGDGSAIVHADPTGRLVAVTQPIPDGYLGRSWSSRDVTLYVGDFNGDGRQDLLLQLKASVPPANQARYALLLADPNGQFLQVNQSWTDTAFGADWSPATHTLSVQTINGVTSIVLTANDGSGSNYVFQADGSGVFNKPAAQWTGNKSAADALKSQGSSKGISVTLQPATTASAPKTAPTTSTPVRAMTMAMNTGSAPVAATTVGSSGGQGGASGGTATYNIPIVVPPGRAGMQPSVSLSYSSRGGNGEVGMGWSLSGQSSIRRCPETVAEDGHAVAVTYSQGDDRLCLDGQRLVAWSGAYGADGTTYRTELDSYVRVTEHGAINSQQSWFEVDYKDGRQAFYGYNSSNSAQNSMLFALVPSGGGLTTPLMWAEGCEEDRNSNNIVYNYAYPGAGGELHLNAIYYTGSGCGTSAVDGNQAVTFTYANRADTSIIMLAGGATYQTQVLTGITTYAGTNSQRQYSLSYSQSGATNRSLLQSVQECGYDSSRNQACLPATTFTWQNAAETYALQPVAVPACDSGQSSEGASTTGPIIQLVGDYDGSGRRAVLCNTTLILLNPNGTVNRTITVNPAMLTSTGYGNGPGTLDKDINGDGADDILTFTGTISGGGTFVADSLGASGFAPADTNVKFVGASGGSGSALGLFDVADMNGDGTNDILQVEPDPNNANQPTLFVHYNQHPQSLTFGGPVKIAVVPAGSTFTVQPDLTGRGVPTIFIQTLSGQPYVNDVIFPQVTSGGVTYPTTQVSMSSLGITDAMQQDQHFFMDINGDGLPDFVYTDINTNHLFYMLNEGGGHFEAPVDAGADPRSATGVSDTLVADVYNDGMQELIYPAKRLAAFCPKMQYMYEGSKLDGDVCFGSALQSGANPPANEDYSIYQYSSAKFVEQADGTFQVVENTNTQIIAQAGLATVGDILGNGLTQVFSPFSTWFTDASWAVDSSGTYGGACPLGYACGYQAASNVNATGNFANAAPDMMRSAVDGLGVTSSWDYYPLSTPMQYSLPNGKTTHFYYAPPIGASNRYADNADGLNDYVYFTSPMYVVGDYNVSNGIGGTNTHDFLYTQAIYNTLGRGFQGFYGVVDIFLPAGGNASTDLRTVQLYHQRFPLSGQLSESWTEPNGNPLDTTNLGPLPASDTNFYEHVVNTPACHVGQGAPWTASTGYLVDGVTCTQDMDAHTYWPFVKQSVVTKQGTAFDYMSTTTKTADYDPDGNYTNGGVTVSDNSGMYTETNADVYTVDESIWWIDQLTSKSVTEQTQYNTPLIAAANGSITRTVNYDYFQDGTRKLKDEYDDQNSACEAGAATSACEKDTAYTYDGFGNLHTATVSSGPHVPVAGTGALSSSTDYAFPNRTTTTSYTSDGYFPYQISNALNQVTTVDSTDPASGQPTLEHDPNGVPTSYVYDAFGRKIRETAGPLPPLAISYTGAYATGTLGPTPHNSVYAVNTTQSGYPSKTTYYDMFNRSLGTGIIGFNNTPTVETQYDALGRVTGVSEPFKSGGTPVWNTTTYDVLDRPLTKTDAEGVQTSYGYSGLTTTITTTPGDASYGTAPSRVDIETRNGLGKLLSIENGVGGGTDVDGTTQYSYDAQGNPLVIQDAAGHQILATYNLLGQKTSVSDPDQGNSSYAYDVLGEVLQQTDAKNQQTTMGYDRLGRMTSRLQPESTTPTTWCYDSPSCASPGTAPYIGKLYNVTQYDGYSETYSYDSSGRPINQHEVIGGTPYDTSTSYDGFGRVDSVTYPASYPDTAPVSNSGSNQILQLGSGGSVAVTLNGSASSAANTVYSTLYTWTQVACANANGPNVTLSNGNAISPTFTATAVGNYCFKLTVSDGFIATPSGTVKVTVEPSLPGTPTAQSELNTNVSVAGDINLAWGASVGATYYRLYEAVDGAPVNQIGPNPTSNSDPLTGKGSLSANHTYTYAVQGCAVVAGTEICGPVTVLSNGVEVTLTPPPPASVNVPANSNWDGSFTVNWPAPTTGVVTEYYADVGYTYFDQGLGKQWQDAGHCSTVSTSPDAINPAAPATSCVVPGNQNSMPSLAGTNYNYVVKVSACNYPTGSGNCGNTVTGGPVNVWYEAPPPTPTLSSSTTSSLDGNFTLSWTAESPVTNYQVWLSTNSATSGFFEAYNETGSPPPASQYVGGALKRNYWYYIVACDQKGCSGHSNTVEVSVTGPAGPAVSLPSKVGAERVTVFWSASSTATSYALMADYCSPGCAGYVQVYSGGALQYTDNAPAGTISGLYYAVACNHAGCNGGPGAGVTFNPDGGGGVGGGCTTCAPVAPSSPGSPSGTGSSTTPDNPSKPKGKTAAPAPVTASGPTASLITPLSVPDETLSSLPDPVLAVSSTRQVTKVAAARPRPRGAPLYAPPVYQAWADAQVMPASGTQQLARLQVEYHYDGAGYLDQLYNAIYPTQVFWTANTLDLFGQVVNETYGNGVVTNLTTETTGRITQITSTSGSTTIQNDTYSWYNVGNLHTRAWQAGTNNPAETFTYDPLNRLTGATLTGTSAAQPEVSYVYDNLGNITSKSDTGTYTYGQAGEYPHGVTSVTGTVNGITNPTYSYDADGNMSNRAGTNITWDSFNLPTCIDAAGGTCTSGANYSAFSYAPDKHRYLQTAVVNGAAETTTYVGNVDIVTTGGITHYKHRISAYGKDVLTLDWMSDSSAPGFTTPVYTYEHTDHLGGVDAVTDATGNPVGGTAFSYGAFGNRRDPASGAAPSASEVAADRDATHRGFTNHEMLDGVGIIHMNGRVYDPALGRFLSVDPIFEFPTNTQSLNPYSYVLNNPLSLTDPSGYVASCPTGQSGCDISDVKASDVESIQKTSNGQLVVNTKDGNSYAVNSVSSTSSNGQGGTTTTTSTFSGSGYSTSVSSSNGASNLQSSGEAQNKPTTASDIGTPAAVAKQDQLPGGSTPEQQSGGPGAQPADAPQQTDPSKLFSVSGGTNNQRKEVNDDLKKIAGTKRGQELMKMQADKGKVLEIRLNSESKDDSRRTPGGPVDIDPDYHPEIWTTKGEIPVSTLRAIAHEIGHGITGIGDTGSGHLDNVNRNENPIMEELDPDEGDRVRY